MFALFSRTSSRDTTSLLTLGRAERTAYTIEPRQVRSRTAVGMSNQGFESIFGEIDAIMIDIMMPFMLIIILDLLSAIPLSDMWVR